MTYGQIARLAGSPRGARQVVRILHTQSEKQKLPWHRVVNGKGEIGFKDEDLYDIQRELLENEGIYFNINKRIDLQEFAHESSQPI